MRYNAIRMKKLIREKMGLGKKFYVYEIIDEIADKANFRTFALYYGNDKICCVYYKFSEDLFLEAVCR